MFIEQNTLTPNDENAGADIRSGACEGIRHALQSCQWQVDNGNGAVLAAQAELNRLPLKFENTLAQLPKARAAAQAAIKRMTPYSLDD